MPVFEKDNNQFIVMEDNFIGSSAEEAMHIGLGASIVECVLWDAHFLHKTLDVTDGVLGAEANIGGVPVVIISGTIHENSVKDIPLL